MFLQIPEPTQRISTKSVQVWRIGEIIENGIALLILGILLYLHFTFDWKVWIGYILYGLIALTFVTGLYSIILKPYLMQKYWRYEISEEFIQLKYGHFKTTHKLIPMTKVEFVSIDQGPIMRKYDLYDVNIGSTTSSHTIPAIPKDKAVTLSNQIAVYAKVKDLD